MAVKVSLLVCSLTVMGVWAEAAPAAIAARTSASAHTKMARRKVTFMFLSLVLSSFAFVVWAWSCMAYLTG